MAAGRRLVVATALKPGSYTDDAQNNGTGDGAGTGIWTFSPPLAHDAHLAGIPKVTVNASITLPDANLVADVYDVDSGGRATLISRGTYLLPGSGAVSFDLYGDDWKLPAGHRVGVLLTSSNSEWWLHRPTLQPVTVGSASISLPWRCARAARRSRAALDQARRLQGVRALHGRRGDDRRRHGPVVRAPRGAGRL